MLGLACDKYHALHLPPSTQGLRVLKGCVGVGRGCYLEDLCIEVSLKVILHMIK